jgi:hypothetical protein
MEGAKLFLPPIDSGWTFDERRRRNMEVVKVRVRIVETEGTRLLRGGGVDGKKVEFVKRKGREGGLLESVMLRVNRSVDDCLRLGGGSGGR